MVTMSAAYMREYRAKASEFELRAFCCRFRSGFRTGRLSDQEASCVSEIGNFVARLRAQWKKLVVRARSLIGRSLTPGDRAPRGFDVENVLVASSRCASRDCLWNLLERRFWPTCQAIRWSS